MSSEQMRDWHTDNISEVCLTVFHMSRMAECMEIDQTICVPDEQELFYAIMDWAKEFHQAFDRSGSDYMSELESFVPPKLQETFPVEPAEDLAPSDGMTGLNM